MIEKVNKKGLSDIIATVLIILLAIAAVAIVWSFISPTIRNTAGEVDLAQTCFNTEVKPLKCDVSEDRATVQLTRGDPTTISAILLIIEHTSGSSTGTTDVHEVTSGITPLGTVDGSVAQLSFVAGDILKAAVRVKDPNDPAKTRTCNENLETVSCTA